MPDITRPVGVPIGKNKNKKTPARSLGAKPGSSLKRPESPAASLELSKGQNLRVLSQDKEARKISTSSPGMVKGGKGGTTNNCVFWIQGKAKSLIKIVYSAEEDTLVGARSH